MSEKLPDINALLKIFKENYLDNRGVGIRRFASMTGISRTKLEKFFQGTKKPDEVEIMHISAAMDIIEVQFQKSKELKEKKEFQANMQKAAEEMLSSMKGN